MCVCVCVALVIQLAMAWAIFAVCSLSVFAVCLHIISQTTTKEIGLEANADKTKYMIMSRDQNAGRIDCMKTDNSSIERV